MKSDRQKKSTNLVENSQSLFLCPRFARGASQKRKELRVSGFHGKNTIITKVENVFFSTQNFEIGERESALSFHSESGK